MQDAAQEAESILKTLGHRHRLMILCQLVEGERPVGELARLLKVRDSTMSQHLALLRKDGLVTTRREGQVIHYALSSGPAKILLEALAQIYCGPPIAGAGRRAIRRAGAGDEGKRKKVKSS